MFEVHAFFNITPATNEHIPMLHGYIEGDYLQKSRLNPMYAKDAHDAQQALDHIFHFLNGDSRPNGRDERSLSVGDVLAVRQRNARSFRWYACKALGWSLIDPPDEAKIKE